MTDYDGRYSADCAKACAEATCTAPRTSEGCGGCCECLGGCYRGYEEQVAEEQAIAEDVRFERTADAADRGEDQ